MSTVGVRGPVYHFPYPFLNFPLPVHAEYNHFEFLTITRYVNQKREENKRKNYTSDIQTTITFAI